MIKKKKIIQIQPKSLTKKKKNQSFFFLNKN